MCEQCDRINHYSMDSSLQCSLCDSNKYSIYLNLLLLFLVVVLFLFNQLYGVIMRINKRLLYLGFSIVFNLNFYRQSQLFAATKLLLMHFQVLYIVLQEEYKELQKIIGQFKIIGNPQVGFSRNLECLVEIEETDSLKKKIGYNVSIYGLGLVIGALVFLIFCQVSCYFCRKFIKNRDIFL